MTLPDYYAVLGLEARASGAEIKKAYQRASLQCHPDRYPDATPEEKRAWTERFQSVADAYYILSDAARRAEYDAARARGQTYFDAGDTRPPAARPWAGRARGFNRGRFFTRDGRRVASVAQEGLLR